ncbi:hypothetical protein ACTID9_11950 [Brevibacillus fluminis]|uniref:hypothetical protein n=1 Tax=Brevibacillus fluminis TaxID=511487 RepID=UPI003F8BB027
MTQTNHMTRSQWQQFILNQLSDQERERYEDHLYSCDECLEVYMACLDELAQPAAPSVPEVAEAIPAHKPAAKPFYRQTLFHYGLAACITLLLMTTGLFSQLLAHSNQWNSIAGAKQHRSVTDQLMQKTTAFLDQLHPITKGGKTGE